MTSVRDGAGIAGHPRWWKCPQCSACFFVSCPEGQWCVGSRSLGTKHDAVLVTKAVHARFVATTDGWQGTYDNTIEAL